MKRRRRRPRKNLLPFAVSFVLFATGLGWGVARTMPYLEGALTGGRVRSIESTSGRNRAEATLRWTLAAFYAKNGHYPSALTGLVESGLASESFLHTVNSYSIRYHLTDDGQRYTLL